MKVTVRANLVWFNVEVKDKKDITLLESEKDLETWEQNELAQKLLDQNGLDESSADFDYEID